MKIAMVSEHASPMAVVGGVDAGGQNVHVAHLSTALAARGHEVVVYTRRDAPDLPDRVTLCPGVEVVHLDAGPPEPVVKDALLPHLRELTDALAAALDEDAPSVLHAHFWMSGLAAVEAVAGAGQPALPVLQTFHALGVVKRRLQGDADTSPRERIGIEREVARRVDRVIATCTDEVRELVSLGTKRARIDVVPSGVDLEHFTPEGPIAPRSNRLRLVTIGRLVPRKGVDDAITAVSLLPDAELIIAGGPAAAEVLSDSEALRLKKLAAELGVGHRVHLIGRVPRAELPKLIRSAEVVVCLPWYEPFGIVPLEAMACGVPVVGTAVGGLLDTVIDGVTGALLPPRDPVAAAEVIATLLAEPQRREAYGQAGAERARAQYGWDAVARSTERSYLRALSARAQDSGRGRSTAEVAG